MTTAKALAEAISPKRTAPAASVLAQAFGKQVQTGDVENIVKALKEANRNAKPAKETVFTLSGQEIETDLPRRTNWWLDSRNIALRAINEAYDVPNRTADEMQGFRLALSSLVTDKCNAAFEIFRNGESVKFQIMYPNDNGKITVMVQLDGVDFDVYEISLEDAAYRSNFGKTILEMADGIIAKKAETMPIELGMPSRISLQKGDNMSRLNTLAPGSSGIGSLESTYSKLDLLAMKIAMLEADGAFTEEDFSANPPEQAGAAPMTNPQQAAGGVNAGATDGQSTVSDDGEEETVKFRDWAMMNFTNGLGGQFDVLANIVSDALSSQLQSGTQGVQLDRYQILNGMTGIKNRPAAEIMNAFLELYPDLDDEFKVSEIETISQKLEESPDPEQFNMFLEGYLQTLQGKQAPTEDILKLPDNFMGGRNNLQGNRNSVQSGLDSWNAERADENNLRNQVNLANEFDSASKVTEFVNI